MKRAERLNQELIFLSSKKSFNLSDLMNEFNISKRTALRDIEDLDCHFMLKTVEMEDIS